MHTQNSSDDSFQMAWDIFNTAPTPYLVLDSQFTIINANEARLAVTNTTLENTVGKNLFEAFPDNPDDPKADGVNNLKASLEKVLRTKKSHRMKIQKYDIPIPTKEGVRFEERYWSPLNFPILDSQNEIKYIIHQVEDVTEEIKSKKEIHDLETEAYAVELEKNRLLSVFNQAPIGICLTKGPNLIIDFANPTYRKMTGVKRQLDGRPLAVAFPDIQEGVQNTLETFRTGKRRIIENLKVTTDWEHNGEPFEKIFLLILEPLLNPEGKPEGVITLAYDDTEKIRSRFEVKESLENLRQEQDMRERFVATLSHDLLTPLTAAKMSAQLLARKADNIDDVRRFSEKINRGLERCEQMISDLLDANRIKAGQTIPIELSKCSLKHTAKETIEELSTVHGDRFILDAPQGDVEGQWSYNGIKRIIENLCNNAIKYGSKEKKIKVIIKENTNSVTLEVQNWGNVITPEDQRFLFDLYNRSGPEEDSKQKGWGLGLTLVKGLTEAHQGTVSVTSSEEQGTIFTVTLPRHT